MIITIDTQELEDANEFGEILREYCFDDTPCMTVTGFNKPYGCYSTFELNKNLKFKQLTPNDKLYQQLAELSGYLNNTNQLDGIEFFAYSNNHIDIGWWWDGDGTLIIKEGNKVAVTSDCKCDYWWTWIN